MPSTPYDNAVREYRQRQQLWRYRNQPTQMMTTSTFYTATTMNSTVSDTYFSIWANAQVNQTASTAWSFWWEEAVELGQQARQIPERLVRSAEEIRREAEIRAQAMEQARAVERRLAEAEERAMNLLLRHLTPAQQESMKRNKWFLVDGPSGKRYRIGTQHHIGNVELLDAKGEPEKRMCCHARSDLRCPLPDHLLTQMMWLRHHEDEFLKTANVHWRR